MTGQAGEISERVEAPSVEAQHLTEALNYRILDRKLWAK